MNRWMHWRTLETLRSFGIGNFSEALSEVKRLISSDLFVIANETIDIKDGGVSGDVQGGIIEFAPMIRHGVLRSRITAARLGDRA
jgi:hypothetical protein